MTLFWFWYPKLFFTPRPSSRTPELNPKLFKSRTLTYFYLWFLSPSTPCALSVPKHDFMLTPSTVCEKITLIKKKTNQQKPPQQKKKPQTNHHPKPPKKQGRVIHPHNQYVENNLFCHVLQSMLIFFFTIWFSPNIAVPTQILVKASHKQTL